MPRNLLAISLLIVSPALVPASVLPLNWVHHSKKPEPVSKVRVAYHGSTAYSAEGRLYFPTANHAATAAPVRPKSRAQRGTGR
jgi:hypothetical protein